jgi:branched-chain amino acid transport system ATP-binding protein
MQLSVENLQVSYGKIKRCTGFHIDEGEIVTIIGANGAGKSTTLRAVSRLVDVESGSEDDLHGPKPAQFRPTRWSASWVSPMCPEGRRLFGNLTVTENMELATFARKDKENFRRDKQVVFDIFPRLKERESQMAGTLSGGEQQMLAVGRAYMSGRKMMLLDEPSMGLAPLLMLSMFDALKEINQAGTTILLVEQNARLALKFAQRGYVIETVRLFWRESPKRF